LVHDALIVVLYRVDGVSRSIDLCLEAGVMVSGVVHGTGGAVRLNQLVVTRDFIAVTFLSLLLDVLGVWVRHSIFELILGVSL
jgi:hypothetical protein